MEAVKYGSPIYSYSQPSSQRQCIRYTDKGSQLLGRLPVLNASIPATHAIYSPPGRVTHSPPPLLTTQSQCR